MLFWQGLIILIILAHSSCVAASATSAHMVNLLYQKLLELDASHILYDLPSYSYSCIYSTRLFALFDLCLMHFVNL